MLQALTAHNQVVSFLDKKEEDWWRQLQREQLFYCPVCKKEVAMRLGSKRKWHFAHLKHAQCPANYERESAAHLQGKEDLFYWVSHKQSAELEKYLPASKQRPDIYVNGPPCIAIEFQCASISLESIHKRNLLYASQRISPIWILGAARMRRQSSQLFRIRHFEWHALRKCGKERFLSYYDPVLKSFCFLRNVLAVQPELVLAHLSVKPIDGFSFKELLTPSPIHCSFEHTLLRYRKKKQFSPLHYNRKFRVFLNTHNRTGFPDAAGWPVRAQCFMQIPAFVWQSYFLLSFLKWVPEGRSFSVNQCEAAMKYICMTFKQPTKPYCKLNSLFKQIIREYMMLLCAFGIVLRESPCTFKRILDVEQVMVDEKHWLKKWQTALHASENLLS